MRWWRALDEWSTYSEAQGTDRADALRVRQYSQSGLRTPFAPADYSDDDYTSDRSNTGFRKFRYSALRRTLEGALRQHDRGNGCYLLMGVDLELVEERPVSVSAPADFHALDDQIVRPLVRDLHRVKPAIYWLDFLLSAAGGWAGLIAAILLPSLSLPMLGCVLLSALAFYRALCFVHELSHQASRTLPHFELVYNLLAGYPMLMPSFVYVGVHQSHHKISVYGTDKDPEYLPFAQSRVMTTLFALESFLIPAVLALRFVLLSPIGFFSQRFQRWLVVHASSLTMNVKYRREFTLELNQRVRRGGFLIFCVWTAYLASAFAGVVSFKILIVWFAVCSLLSFINTLRTLGAHAYESDGQPMDRLAQLQDSIDTPGAFWTELWAPVGLRYHALHHYYPGIPYHSLPAAYNRIVSTLAVADEYRQMTSPGLPVSLAKLLKSGARKRP